MREGRWEIQRQYVYAHFVYVRVCALKTAQFGVCLVAAVCVHAQRTSRYNDNSAKKNVHISLVTLRSCNTYDQSNMAILEKVI